VTLAAILDMTIFFSSQSLQSMLLTYFLNDFETVPVAPIITGITLILYCTYAGFLLQSPYTGHTQQNGSVLIVNTIKTAPFFCVCPVL
jgi:hypothetical protein